MEVNGLPSIGSAAGAPLPQTKGAETGRVQTESAAQTREMQSDALADRASGVGQTDGDELASDQRDADGRRPWEAVNAGEINETKNETSPSTDGEKGKLLDLIA